MVSYFANNYPSFGVPEIIHFEAKAVAIMDEAKRVKDAKSKREEQEAARQAAKSKRELEEAQKRARDAQENLKRVRNKHKSLT